MSKRANSRKLAMRMLYQLGIRKIPLSVIFNDIQTDGYAKETIEWAYELVQQADLHMSDVDEIITKYAIDWHMDRLNYIDKALLRLGISEINYTNTPYQVVLNEVIELSKLYSTEESAKFINGILGKYVSDSCSQD